MATVDIVIPFFNTPIHYVKAALDSAMAQTFSDSNILVCDDGSDEQNAAALRVLLGAYDDRRIRYIAKQHSGLSATRNVAIRASDSPYIAFLDSDDIWYPDKLEKQLRYFEDNQQVDILYGGVDSIDAEGRITYPHAPCPEVNRMSVSEQFLRMLEQHNFVSIMTLIMRREVAEEAGLFDESLFFCEDKDFWLRLLHGGHKFYLLDEPMGQYRVHELNMSRDVDRACRGRLRVVEKSIALVEDSPLADQIDLRRLRRRMIHNAYLNASWECLETHRYGQAIKYCLPWYAGVSRETTKMVLRSFYHMLLPGIKQPH